MVLLIKLQLHSHALLNSKPGVSVNENGKQLDDEIFIILSEVRIICSASKNY
jgi:hypothetical protein